MHNHSLSRTVIFVVAFVLGALLIFSYYVTPAPADYSHVADRWEQYRLNPLQKQWFGDLRSKSRGYPCCSVADGYPADDWERKADEAGKAHYWVLLDGKWWEVPDEAVILDHGNPVGVPVVWFTTAKDAIRCFVPGPEN